MGWVHEVEVWWGACPLTFANWLCAQHPTIHVYLIVYQYSSHQIYTDMSGKIRIWDTTQKEHILKYEYQPISGKIKDIVWSPDSKRIAICGEGREK